MHIALHWHKATSHTLVNLLGLSSLRDPPTLGSAEQTLREEFVISCTSADNQEAYLHSQRTIKERK